MKCFISNIKSDSELTTDVKLLIPDATMRRRMSDILKRSVATAVECIGGVDNISALDAIITSTCLGLLSDSEKFLKNIVENEENLINPTPFIQSTFNTVGAQIALLKNNHCYNVTYVNRFHAFEDALADALFKLSDNKCNNALIGHYDEVTPTLTNISHRLNIKNQSMVRAGAFFFQCKAERSADSIAVLEFDIIPNNDSEEYRRRMLFNNLYKTYGVTPDNTIVAVNSQERYDSFFPASAASLFDAVKSVKHNRCNMILINEYQDNCTFVMSVKNV